MNTTRVAITKRAGRCGGEACVRDTRYTVWGLVELRRLGLEDAGILAVHQELSQDDLDAAWAYAAEHPLEIERALWENEAALIDPEASGIPEEFLERGRRLGLSEADIRAAFHPPLPAE